MLVSEIREIGKEKKTYASAEEAVNAIIQKHYLIHHKDWNEHNVKVGFSNGVYFVTSDIIDVELVGVVESKMDIIFGKLKVPEANGFLALADQDRVIGFQKEILFDISDLY